MIVDMIRNDMGRIAEMGTVHVPRLFEAERYPTVWQMTSTVSSQTTARCSEILKALFPCASITGAPKVSAMRIIADLEPAARGVYTGAIGYLAPGGRAQFNVAIRTVVVDRLAGRAVYGVGSGVVWDSDADEEYDECLVKARVLVAKPGDFSLLETMLWQPGEGIFLLGRHLRRLADSAKYFGFPIDPPRIKQTLAAAIAALPDQAHRVRLLVDQHGGPRVETQPLPAAIGTQPLRLGLAIAPVDREDVFLYHKTTRREIYNTARRARPDCDDVLLWNERGEITETCIANVAVRLDGELVTPPADCGLLAGTLRGELLEAGVLRERAVRVEDMARCAAIFVFNSVRGWRIAELIADATVQDDVGR
jgi:para-aminobenzoate synthetase/4-amino-4-deoxychorismate lyase